MNIVILGAGALGTVLGAHLARAGEDVTLIARGQRAAYLQAHGATLTGLVDFTVPVSVVTDPSQVQKAAVLIVTVKTYDMAPALQSLKHLQVESVLSLQNGVLKNEQLAQTFGWDKVLGAMTHFSAEVLPTDSWRAVLVKDDGLSKDANLRLRGCSGYGLAAAFCSPRHVMCAFGVCDNVHKVLGFQSWQSSRTALEAVSPSRRIP